MVDMPENNGFLDGNADLIWLVLNRFFPIIQGSTLPPVHFPEDRHNIDWAAGLQWQVGESGSYGLWWSCPISVWWSVTRLMDMVCNISFNQRISPSFWFQLPALRFPSCDGAGEPYAYPTQDYLLPDCDLHAVYNPEKSFGTESPKPSPVIPLMSSETREKYSNMPDNQLGMSPSPMPTEMALWL